MWIKIALMHFSAATAHWLQSVEKGLKYVTCGEFCQMLLARFGRDQHELPVRQLFRMKQIGTVSEHIDKFAELVDQLHAYESHTDPLHYTMRFIEGLRPDLQASVLVQRPSDLDTAYVLARLQEEVAEARVRKDYRRPDAFTSFKPVHRGPFAASTQAPTKTEPHHSSVQAEDRRSLEASHARASYDKVAALRAYRRAQGLCQRCAEKWTRDHKCPASIQLQVLQEVWDLFPCEDQQQSASDEQPSTEDAQLFLVLSEVAVMGTEAPRTMHFAGRLFDRDILILVDSGSTHTFVSSRVIRGLANGNSMQCSAYIADAVWSVQGCQFMSDLKVLELQHFDMIVGMDWLERISPMRMHWKQKWLDIPFFLTDASAHGIGAVLMQQGHPLAYLSKALGPKNSGLSTYEKECLAILTAVDHWRHYLQHAEFHIYTDQKSLVQLWEQRLHTPWQQRYKIVYKKGIENRVADTLSRKSSSEYVCTAISVASPQWITQLADSYVNDSHTQSMTSKLIVDPTAVPGFSFRDGLLRYKNHIWQLSRSSSLLALCANRLNLIEPNYQDCCNRYRSLPWPGKWFLWILLRDYPVRMPLPNTVTSCPSHIHSAAGVAKIFHDQVYRLHGMPTHLISDRDRVFTSRLWKELFRLADVRLCMSSAYNPQSDGQTERLNQTLETFLRCFVNACPSKWSQWVSLVEYWYNNNPHSAIGRSPFEALYGYIPRHFGISVDTAVEVPDLASWLHDRHLMTDLVQQHLARAKLRMKKQADKHRIERSFREDSAEAHLGVMELLNREGMSALHYSMKHQEKMGRLGQEDRVEPDSPASGLMGHNGESRNNC
ncbi:hypothetical protein U9M48_012480 [Paspalum notatum var. saurae]|uniref:Integrase catalytic domain-containing protein n=1 Tax=Paspalum notatum var. saurae TaxID=547442 RepID=A0AAQ3SXJ1_PASNO